MADLFRDGAFPRRIDRIIVRTEASIYLIGGIILLFVMTAEGLDEQELRSPLRTVIEAITSSLGVKALGVAAMVVGIYALWSVNKKVRRKHLEHAIFAFFIIRLYVFLASLITMDGPGDARWINHFPWVVIWGAYWLISRLRVTDE